jgi:hypothetical protein
MYTLDRHTCRQSILISLAGQALSTHWRDLSSTSLIPVLGSVFFRSPVSSLLPASVLVPLVLRSVCSNKH